MNFAQLLTYFDRLCETPDSIPFLRRFIFDLAVRGELVEQNPNDEPVPKLLDRIHTVKSRSLRHGKQIHESIRHSIAPFQIPKSWEWIPATYPVSSISDKGKKIHTRDVLDLGDFPVIDQGKIFIRGYCNDSSKVIHIEDPIILFGDHTREIKLIDFDFVVGGDGVKLLKPICLHAEYYYIALKWLPLDTRGYSRHFKSLRSAVIPVPPIEEQQRIVNKIKAFMRLFNSLELSQIEREQQRDRLVTATLHHLNNGSDVNTFRTQSRFYLNHIPRLTTHPEHIKQLRNTILNLAVQGKLVQQEPNDAPALELLKQIQSKKHELVQSGLIRGEKVLPVVLDHEIPFSIPSSWIWTRLGTCSLLIEYGTSFKSNHAEDGVPVLRMGDINNGQVLLSGQKKVPPTIDDLPRLFLKRFDILYNRTNSAELVGKTGIFLGDDDVYTFASYLIRIRFPNDLMNPTYSNLAMNAPYFRETQILPEVKQQCGQANVNGTKLRNMIIPLPPTAEQFRIVSKVNELIAVCDELEFRINETSILRRKFLEAILIEAITVSN